MAKLLHIHPDDNVLVVCEPVAAGDALSIGGHTVRMSEALGLGHKVSAVLIARGEKVIKFGIPIGSATQDIQPGAHVHLHNLKSDYLPTYTLTHEYITE